MNVVSHGHDVVYTEKLEEIYRHSGLSGLKKWHQTDTRAGYSSLCWTEERRAGWRRLFLSPFFFLVCLSANCTRNILRYPCLRVLKRKQHVRYSTRYARLLHVPNCCEEARPCRCSTRSTSKNLCRGAAQQHSTSPKRQYVTCARVGV